MSRLVYFLSLLLILLIACKKKDDDMPSPPPPLPYIPVKLDSSSFVIGNRQVGIQDTFILHFNKPVSVKYIILINNTCLPSLTHVAANNGKTIKFSQLLCGVLGRTFDFEFSVTDEKGNTYKDSVSFSYYTRKLPIEGKVISYFITPDNKYCWATTTTPNRIYCMGIDDTSYKKVYDLNFIPAKIVSNQYNQKLYILSFNDYNYNPDADKLYVMNPVNGNIDKVITIPKDQYDDPQDHLTAWDLDFGANGYGIILTGKRGYGRSRWRVLDSRYNDTIYAHPEWVTADNNTGNYNFREFERCQVNYNKTKLYLRGYNAIARMGVLDCNTGTLTELPYCFNLPNHYIVPHKTTDKFFVASYGNQTIMADGSCGNYTQFSNIHSATADFSYRSNEEDIVYYMNYDDYYGRTFELLILDYANGQVLMKTNLPADFKSMTTTTDGRHMLALTGDAIVLFKTDLLYRYL